MHDTRYLYDTLGRRLYLTPGERDVFLRTALGHDRPVRTFWVVSLDSVDEKATT